MIHDRAGPDETGKTTYDEALAVQRRHENRILQLPGVTGIGVRLRDGQPVLEVSDRD